MHGKPLGKWQRATLKSTSTLNQTLQHIRQGYMMRILRALHLQLVDATQNLKFHASRFPRWNISMYENVQLQKGVIDDAGTP